MKYLIFFLFFISKISFSNENIKDLLSIALSNSPQIISTKNELEISSLNLKNASSIFSPIGNINLSNGLSGDFKSTSYNKNISISFQNNLFNNGIDFFKFSKQKINHEIATLENKMKIDNFILNFLKSVYQYYLYDELEKISEIKLKFLKGQFKNIEAKYKSGKTTRIDYLRFKSKLGQSLINKKNQTSLKTNLLNEIILLVSPEKGQEIKKILGKKNESFFDLKSITWPSGHPSLREHSLYKIQSLKSDISVLNLKMERKSLLPKVTLESFLSFDNDFSSKINVKYGVSLNLGYTFYDAHKSQNSFKIAVLNEVIAKQNIRQEIFTLEKDLVNLISDLKIMKESHELGLELSEIEKSNFKNIDKNFKLGKVSFLDYMSALNDFIASQETLLTEIFNIKNKILKFNFYSGKLRENI